MGFAFSYLLDYLIPYDYIDEEDENETYEQNKKTKEKK